MELLSLDDFIKQLPKIELHAHLNGSISENILKELYGKKYNIDLDNNIDNLPEIFEIYNNPNRTLNQCFPLFDLIHALTNDINTIKSITKEVILDFWNDNVKYLELRTTPRIIKKDDDDDDSLNEIIFTKNCYINAVIEGIEEVLEYIQTQEGDGIIVGLLLSINRRDSVETAINHVELAKEWKLKKPDLIKGIDFSGNPHLNTFKEFAPALDLITKDDNLDIAIHIGEVDGEDEENKDIIDYILKRMEDDQIRFRIGHFAFSNEESFQLVINNEIPLELCLTSNLISYTHLENDVANHHIKDFLEKDHPIILCTDDKGLFSTTLSKEYTLLAKAFNMDKQNIYHLSKLSICSIFDSDETKSSLNQIWDNFYNSFNF